MFNSRIVGAQKFNSRIIKTITINPEDLIKTQPTQFTLNSISIVHPVLTSLYFSTLNLTFAIKETSNKEYYTGVILANRNSTNLSYYCALLISYN